VTKLFLPQATLETWAAEGRADLREGKLFVGPEKASCPVAPAVHFSRVVSGTDARKLIDTVKTPIQLEQMGAEQMSDSVIVGEDAYDVIQGYLAELALPAPEQSGDESEDSDLLAAFLLDKMT
jgi:hypothetical protein